MYKKIVLIISFVLLLSSVPRVVSEKTAPDFTLTDIDGVEFSLSDYRGRVVLLDFFATYCGPCVREMQHLKVVHEDFGQDLKIISISVNPNFDTTEKLMQFRQEHGIDWTIARDTIGVREQYINTIPTLVIIDQQGYIRYVHSGGLTAASILSQEISYIFSLILTADINSDGKVNIIDVSLVAKSFGNCPEDAGWNETLDLNRDESINVLDIAIVAKEYGKMQSPFNFLFNASVEIDEDEDNSPEYWHKYDYGDTDAVYEWLNTGHTGNHSIKVYIAYNTSAPSWHSVQWYQSFTIFVSPFEVGSRYLFRFWYKSSIKCYIYASFWDNDDQWIGSRSVECKTATTWTQSQWLEFTIPERTHRMAVGFALKNGDAIEETNCYAIGDDFELIHG